MSAVILLETMPTKLEEIVAATRRKVAGAKASADVRAMSAWAENREPRGFRNALREGAEHLAVIAELKKASPSKGVIRENFSVIPLARELEQAGAAALSVLTNEEFFQGSLQNLSIASTVTHLPCLRKDFIVDEFQVVEARANGADAILLIVAALSDGELLALQRSAREVGLDILCEVHDAGELKRAVDGGFDMIGINNRNLHTFQIDLNTSLELVGGIPGEVVKVTESGIENGEDIARLRQAGFDAFLIGESLMRSPSPGDELYKLLMQAALAS